MNGVPNSRIEYPESSEVHVNHPEAETFLEFCRAHKQPGELARGDAFNAFDLKPWLGNLMILEPVADDFRYRLYGTKIAEFSGFDLTGRLVGALRSPVREFFLHTYGEALGRCSVLYTVHEGPLARYRCIWHRIICPAHRKGGPQIIAGNFPTLIGEPESP